MDLPIIELAGSARQMGEGHGERCREEIRALYALRMEATLRFLRIEGRAMTRNAVLAWARACLPHAQAYDASAYEEFLGIAHAAGLEPEELYALQGMTDLRDGLAFGPCPEGEGCTSFVVGTDRSAAPGLLAGQTWDLHTDNMPFVRLVRRQPDDAPETWSLTLTGCLSMIGVNAAGLAICCTNLVTTDARAGVHYLFLMQRALRSLALEEAVQAVLQARRAGAHYYVVAGSARAVGLECSARRATRRDISAGHYVHGNHALSPEISAVQAHAPTASSRARQRRFEALLRACPHAVRVGDLKTFLSDHEGGTNAICRHDAGGISTNAAVILSPARREIHACRAQPHIGRWVLRTCGNPD